MPQEIQRSGPQKTIRIRFIKNKSYAGAEYGPDYNKKPVDVREDWAKAFIAQDAAVRVEEGAKASKRAAPADDPDALPADFPGRTALVAAGVKSLAAVRELSLADLIAIKGIGEATANEIAEAAGAGE